MTPKTPLVKARTNKERILADRIYFLEFTGMSVTAKNPNQGISRKQEIFFGRIFPWFFFVPGIIIVFFGLRSYQESRASAEWPSVEGEIRSSEVVRSSTSDGTSFRAEVTYTYRVDGQNFTGDRIQTTTVSSSNRSRAVSIQRQYPVGQSVEVFYNPERPDRALLEPGVRSGSLFVFAFGGLFSGAGLLMILFLPKLIAYGAKLETEHQNFRETPSPVGISREPLPGNSCYSWVPLKYVKKGDGSVLLRPGTGGVIPGIFAIIASPVLYQVAIHFNWDSELRFFATLIPLFIGVLVLFVSILMRLLMTKHSLRPRENLWKIIGYGSAKEELPLQDILAVQVIPGNKVSNDQGGGMLPYQINFVLPEDQRKNLLQSADRKGCLRLARKIAAFLQVPLVGLEIESPRN